VNFNNYYLSPITYKSVFDTIGFSSFKWHNPQLSPEERISTFHSDYWTEFLTHPPIIGIEAVN